MSSFKGTPGPCTVEEAKGVGGPFFYVRESSGLHVVILTDPNCWGRNVTAANAALIADAFNIAHETGRTPRELADENARLRAAMEKIVSKDGRSWVNLTVGPGSTLDDALAALAPAAKENP